MEKALRNILINSTLSFVAAFIVTTIIHETGHYAAYLYFGSHAVIFHNYVAAADPLLPVNATIIVALAGPGISLVQGVLCTFIITRDMRNTTGRLLLLWMGLLGFVNFFGYLVMTPFTTTGDTGKAAELLNMDRGMRVAIAPGALIMLIWVISRVAENFSRFIPVHEDKRLRSKYVYRLMFFPIMIGSAVNVLLALPAAAILSVIYPASSSFVIMSAFPRILKASYPNAMRSILEEKIQPFLIILFVCAVIINRILTLGIG